MGTGWTAIVVGACALGIVAACSHGIYDGAGHAADGGTSSGLVADVPASTARTLTTDDKFFALQIPADAFSAPTRIEVKQLGDRQQDGLVVPVYEVTSTAPIAAGKSVIVVLSAGNSFGGGGVGPPQRLGVASLESGTATLLAGGIAPNNLEYFGITSKLGQFTIGSGTEKSLGVRPGNPASTSCFYNKCCQLEQNQERSCVDGKPFCQRSGGSAGPNSNPRGSAGTTDFACYFTCTDVDVAVAVCKARAAGESPLGDFQCGSSGQCTTEPCCVGLLKPPACDATCAAGLKVRCTKSSQCIDSSEGAECCLVAGEVRCSNSCNGQRVCEDTTDCGGPSTCTRTAKCPFLGTCTGTPAPAACQ